MGSKSIFKGEEKWIPGSMGLEHAADYTGDTSELTAAQFIEYIQAVLSKYGADTAGFRLRLDMDERIRKNAQRYLNGRCAAPKLHADEVVDLTYDAVRGQLARINLGVSEWTIKDDLRAYTNTTLYHVATQHYKQCCRDYVLDDEGGMVLSSATADPVVDPEHELLAKERELRLNILTWQLFGSLSNKDWTLLISNTVLKRRHKDTALRLGLNTEGAAKSAWRNLRLRLGARAEKYGLTAVLEDLGF